MDIDMDVDYDASATFDAGAPQQIDTTTAGTVDEMPAAYFEDLSAQPTEQWPDFLNLQGVHSFDPNDPLYYAMEHCLEPRVKQTRWINDNSVNLQYYSAADAAIALQSLTDPTAGDAALILAETARKARPYSKRPEIVLTIRQANAGDQKAKGAANRSNFYKQHPDLRGDRGERRDYGRDRKPRRRSPPQRDFLDYGDDASRSQRRSGSGDDRMRDDSDYDNRRNRRNDNRERNEFRDKNSRFQKDTDSYRPGTRSPRESRFGRLRGRSASPGSGDDGDGRYGFTEQGTNTRSRYRSRSRSRSRHNNRRRRDVSGERWEHDRATFGEQETTPGRWTKDHGSHHRRSDAFDDSRGSLLERMTKDGKPLAPQSRPLASRITRDGDDDGESYGRLKDDYDFHAAEFDEPAPRDLASRISRDDDGIQIRGRGNDGINIRGASGFSIRGVAGGN
ncbi:hypothetical protein P280DRAFT_523406 [Massarina eburnea CBS 473.64]|uniref:Uncharacterized protein n=1 Tax=Massarina eburnea CBS 473.64 TaxID=1395130 RepID=A0A6A6RJ80_9PLEO|nr:hypothetical protein P280DRAFT_523406 [Massarina eburnea CBS 473.64]